MKDVKKFIFMEFLFLIAVGIVFFSTSSEAGVDMDIFSVEENPVYKEWTGSYAPSEINTRKQIYDIGHRLGRGILYQENEQDPLPFVKGNPAYKYSAARIYGSDKRGADIIYIGETATVDTIKCLSMIISGYLQSAFVMGAAESDAIAKNICYWNTSVYNNLDFFKESFDEGVLKIFKDRTEQIGLSSNYKEWAGRTKIIIPHTFTAPVVVEETKEPEPVIEPEPVVVAEEDSVPETSYNSAYTIETVDNEGFKFSKGFFLWCLIAVLIAIGVVIAGLAWYFAPISLAVIMLLGYLLGFSMAVAKVSLSMLPFVVAIVIVFRVFSNSKKSEPITNDDDDDKTVVAAN